jgi:hypothetical protein
MLAVILGAIALFAQTAGSPIVPPIETHTTITNNLIVPPPDPALIADASVQSSEAVLNTMIVPPPLQWSNDLLGLPDIWRTTPDNLTWDNGAIKSLAELLRQVAFALIALAVLNRGIRWMLGSHDWHDADRLAMGVILSLGNLIWWQWGIQLNDAITAAIAAPDLPSLIRPHLVTTLDPGTAVGTVVLLLVYAIVALMLLFSLMFRLGLVDILIACGSLALLMYSTEQTTHIASHYTRMAVAVLFSQVLIVLCIRVASVLAELGTGGVLGTLISIVILWLARSAPQAILAGSSSSQGNHWAGTAARLVMRRMGR